MHTKDIKSLLVLKAMQDTHDDGNAEVSTIDIRNRLNIPSEYSPFYATMRTVAVEKYAVRKEWAHNRNNYVITAKGKKFLKANENEIIGYDSSLFKPTDRSKKAEHTPEIAPERYSSQAITAIEGISELVHQNLSLIHI